MSPCLGRVRVTSTVMLPVCVEGAVGVRRSLLGGEEQPGPTGRRCDALVDATARKLGGWGIDEPVLIHVLPHTEAPNLCVYVDAVSFCQPRTPALKPQAVRRSSGTRRNSMRRADEEVEAGCAGECLV